MSTNFSPSTILTLAIIFVMGVGCASKNVNPSVPKLRTGYVDCYAEPSSELWWDVQRFDPGANRFSTVFSELKPLEGRVLRLAFVPERHRLRVTFLNRLIAEPAVFEVNIREGQITPVRITF